MPGVKPVFGNIVSLFLLPVAAFEADADDAVIHHGAEVGIERHHIYFLRRPMDHLPRRQFLELAPLA